MRLLLVVILATAALAQEPRQGQVKIGASSVPYLFDGPAEHGKRPTLVVLPGGGEPQASYKQWRAGMPAGWALLMPLVPGLTDGGAKAIEAVLNQATGEAGIDRSRAYLAGAGSASAEVFYSLARLPGVFAAGLAVEGNPMAAINTNRLFAINTQHSPLLWLNPPEGLETASAKLKEAGYRFEAARDMNTQQIFQWLFQQQLVPNPLKVDCEIHSPAFARCYWLELSKFDLKKKNDVLTSTRVRPGTGASLDLGGFGYDPKAPGPGLLVAWLPEKYSGPLQLNDRILSVGGREIASSRDYMEYIDSVPEAKQTSVMVQRGEDRIRLDTRFVLPVREQTVTARVQGEYLPDQKELLLITRAVAGLQVHLPGAWEVARIRWNGFELTNSLKGCLALAEKEGEASVSTCTPGGHNVGP